MRALPIVVLATTLATMLAATAAHADRDAAVRAFHAGERAYKAQNFGAAAQLFEEAYKQLALPEIAFSAAQAYRRQYRVDPRLELAKRAVDLYRVYLDKVKQGGRVGDAADSLGEMQREVDKLTAAGAKAASAASGGPGGRTAPQEGATRLGISPQLTAENKGAGSPDLREIADLPESSDVKLVTLLDGKPVPPFEMIEVPPGPHTIHVEAEGYLPKDTTERAVKGVSSVIEVVLSPRPAKLTVA